jgi:RND family efflux transporter MFP subunit
MNARPESCAFQSSPAHKARFQHAWWVRGSVLIALCSVGSIALSGCDRRDEKATASSPVLVRVVEIDAPQSSTSPDKRYTGVVQARTESTLGFRVAGKIAERLVNAGDSVKSGQPLLKLDPVDYELALQAARAGVEAARAVQTQASLHQERIRVLVDEGAESRDLLEKANAAAESSSANLRSAVAQADRIAHEAGYTALYADSDGIVMTTHAEPGQVVAAGQAVIVLARDGAREAAVDIPESSLKRIRSHDATAQLYLNPDVSVPAALREISGVADPVARTYQARYVLEGEAARFPLGATVTVRVSTSADGSPTTTEIPLGSLIDRGDGAAVWVVDPKTSTLQKRDVAITRLGAETALVERGLAPGDLVVALGAQLLNSGQIVRLMKSSAQEAK